MKHKVLVVDDSVLYRKLVADIIEDIPFTEVVGRAPNGKLALAIIKEFKPDMMILDIKMPVMDGISLLKALKEQEISIGVIVLSALDHQGSRDTMTALEGGAFDFIPKPSDKSFEKNIEILKKSLVSCINAYIISHPLSSGHKKITTILSDIKKRIFPISQKPEMVLIAVSTGGPLALSRILPELPENFPVPLLIVQHMPSMFTKTLADSLNSKCRIPVKEAEDYDIVKQGNIYLAPGQKQMKVMPGNKGMIIRVTNDPPEDNCQPSANYLFRSVALNFPGKAVAVILTGMGSDGVKGVRLLKRHGCHCIVQDEETSTVFGMPMNAIKVGVADVVVPLKDIPGEIIKSVGIP